MMVTIGIVRISKMLDQLGNVQYNVEYKDGDSHKAVSFGCDELAEVKSLFVEGEILACNRMMTSHEIKEA